MKKFVFLFISLVLLLSFCGCSAILPPEEASTEATENTPIFAICDGKVIEPYKSFLWAETWSGDGWIAADGMRISSQLPTISHTLPTINGKDFDIHYGSGISPESISVYNSEFECIHNTDEPCPTDLLEEGTYYLVITVIEQGKFIPLQGKHESSCYEYAYKIVIQNDEN